MIRLDSASARVDSSVLKRPGGFAWWYAEVMDSLGSGAVVIWSYGLPFLPGYKSAVDKGEHPLPESRPSLNVALYEYGKPSFYLLHEFEPADVHWNGEHEWRFGDTRIAVVDDGNQRRLTLDLSCPVADGGQQLTGDLELSGPIPVNAADSTPNPSSMTHLWTPLAVPARGRFDFRTDDYQLDVKGHAYFDRNTSECALHQLEIERWFWAHAPCEHGDRIVYLLWKKGESTPVCLGYELAFDGTLVERRDLSPKLPKEQRTFYGMPTWPWVEIWSGTERWMRMSLDCRLDNGPFYLRYFTDVTMKDGSESRGSAEVILPDRVDLSRHRPLVKMRVSSDVERNSIWLPLFQGASQTRLKRLVKRHLPFGGAGR